MNEFYGFACESEPRFPVEQETLGESREPDRAAEAEGYCLTVTGTFSSGIEAALPALVERLAASDHPRTPLAPDRAVRRIGETLVVDGLRTTDEGHPLVAELEALGADRVLVEGDRGGEGTIVVDVCAQAPSTREAAALADELLDYWALFYYMWGRPPWHPLELSPDERLARRTFRELAAQSERQPLRDLFRRSSAGPDAHPGVARLYRKRPRTLNPARLESWGEELGRFTGPFPGGKNDTALGAATGQLRREGERLDLAWIAFDRFGAGFPAFLAYLWQRGCREIRYDLVDFDAVRCD